MTIKKYKVHIKTGDKVKIISGKYKGQIGTVNKVMPKKNKITIQNINIIKKHVKPKQQSEKGQIISIEGALHSSKVKIYNDN